MNQEIEIKPKVFISYSWTTAELKEWVVMLAQRLVGTGVDVVLDVWELKKGHDKYEFMEQSVTNPAITKVLMILDKGYAKKADDRTGGVGTETQIISPSIYGEVRQEKFIPIVYERDEKGEVYSPAFLRSRVYTDLSDEATFEENFEELIRAIIDKPSQKKPPLGKLPSYLLDDQQVSSKTGSLLLRFDHILRNKPKLIDPSIQEFLDGFLIIFPSLAFQVSDSDTSYPVVGKQIIDVLEGYAPRKEEFVQFFDKLFRSGEPFDTDLLIHFLEQANDFKDKVKYRYEAEVEQYKFVINELFLSLAALAIKYKNYQLLGDLIHSKYAVQVSTGRPIKQTFVLFYQNIETIDTYYKQLKGREFSSAAADLLINRVAPPLTKKLLIEADLTCYYVSELENIYNSDSIRDHWFPILYVYKENHQPELIINLTSARHFERVKPLFTVSTADELKSKISLYESENKDTYPINYGRTHILMLHKLIKADSVATER